MTVLRDIRGYARFAAGLHGFLKHPLTLDDARCIIRELDKQRTANFLRLVERGVFAHPGSPYLRLMQHAGATFADIEAMVSRDGVERTLQALYKAGVYVTFEEFKGRKPIIRNDLILNVTPSDFENPHTVTHYYATTGGSTGAGTRVGQDLDFQRMIAVFQSLAHDAHGMFGAPTAIWRGMLPDGSGLNNILRLAAFGFAPEAWFTPNKAEPLKRGYLKYALASYWVVIASRFYGSPVAWPQHVPLSRAEVVARWAEQTLRKHGRCSILASASRGLRVALAAERAGIDLTGAVFGLAGEPVTQAKVDGIRRVGGAVFTTYGAAEVGRVGMGCADPAHHTDVHVNAGMHAVYSQPVEAPGFVEPVPAICVTSLHPAAPFISLNYLSDDYGVIEQRRCGCPLGELGLDLHIRHIYSYSKLVGEGVTLAGSDMTRVLEEVLPAKFGGSPLDYQLHEVEEDGLIRFDLIVSPRVQVTDEQSVIDEMMRHLQHDSIMADVAREIWQQANTVRIRREEPTWTDRGKFLPIRKLKRA